MAFSVCSFLVLSCSLSFSEALAELEIPVAKPVYKLPTSAVPQVKAPAVYILDVTADKVLYEKNAQAKRAVASTQKLLTAVCALDAGSYKKLTVQKTDTYAVPSKLYLKVGEVHTRRELIKALLIKSPNDAALAIARDVSGSKAAFAKRMNRTARSIGMKNSNFLNPHGLTQKGQYSTAEDIGILAEYASRYPLVRSAVKTRKMIFKHSDGRVKTLINTNEVLKRLSYCTGMKTGTTRAAGNCLVSSGKLNGRFVICVVLGSATKNDLWKDSTALLKWALEG